MLHVEISGNAGCKKLRKIRHLGTIALCRAISSQLGHVSTIGKNLLNCNISPTHMSPTHPYNMVNFGTLAPEICWRVWGTPANFNGFCILAALLHSTLLVGVCQTAALNRGRQLYLAKRPSRLALAHIVVLILNCSESFILVNQQQQILQCCPCVFTSTPHGVN